MGLFYSSLFILGIIVCICNMCKDNICLPVSSRVHYSMKQWSIGDAGPFLTTLLLVNNASCSGCCISCAQSLLILKMTQVPWFSLCGLKEHSGKAQWGKKGIPAGTSHWIISAQHFWEWILSQEINYFVKIVFYLLHYKVRLPISGTRQLHQMINLVEKWRWPISTWKDINLTSKLKMIKHRKKKRLFFFHFDPNTKDEG